MSTTEDQRPWGYYQVLSDEPDHKVKRIVVYPDKRLSLQRHQRRSEHWYVIKGQAVVTLDDHVNARGTGVISVVNPHGLTGIDLGLADTNAIEKLVSSGITLPVESLPIESKSVMTRVKMPSVSIKGLRRCA